MPHVSLFVSAVAFLVHALSYMLDLRVEAGQRGAVQRMVQRLAPGATLSEKGAGHLSFSLPSAGLDLPTLFSQVWTRGTLSVVQNENAPMSSKFTWEGLYTSQAWAPRLLHLVLLGVAPRNGACLHLVKAHFHSHIFCKPLSCESRAPNHIFVTANIRAQ